MTAATWRNASISQYPKIAAAKFPPVRSPPNLPAGLHPTFPATWL
ncbi:hypothetical protein [Calothrix sp. NIES-2100]